MGGHHHNGVAYNEINNVFRIAITMMIHAATRWPDASDKTLWNMAMEHSIQLYNHIPHIYSGMSLGEVWTSSKSSHSALHNYYSWVCPEYVLELRIQDGNKLPKWMKRSSRDQYFGTFPMHAITVGLVRNLQTVNIIPQFNLVFDDYFETLHAGEYQEPPVWSEFITFQSFKSAYDDEDYVPELADEWLEPADLESRRH